MVYLGAQLWPTTIDSLTTCLDWLLGKPKAAHLRGWIFCSLAEWNPPRYGTALSLQPESKRKQLWKLLTLKWVTPYACFKLRFCVFASSMCVCIEVYTYWRACRQHGNMTAGINKHDHYMQWNEQPEKGCWVSGWKFIKQPKPVITMEISLTFSDKSCARVQCNEVKQKKNVVPPSPQVIRIDIGSVQQAWTIRDI